MIFDGYSMIFNGYSMIFNGYSVDIQWIFNDIHIAGALSLRFVDLHHFRAGLTMSHILHLGLSMGNAACHGTGTSWRVYHVQLAGRSQKHEINRLIQIRKLTISPSWSILEIPFSISHTKPNCSSMGHFHRKSRSQQATS